MDSSKFEEQDQEQIKISIDNPHNGERIHNGKGVDEYIFSPKMQYLATWSKEDKSIIVWTIKNELIIEYEYSLNDDDIKYHELAGISDCKQIILITGEEIIDTTTKSRQELRAQGLTKLITSIAFLENGDLAIVNGEPVYRAYIFTKSKSNNNDQWICKKSFELEKFYFCTVGQNRKLFVFYAIPSFAIMQWDLITQKFDKQYMLYSNSNLSFWSSDFKIKLNSDNTFFAIAYLTYDVEEPFYNVHVYSTKTGMMIANRKFDERLHNFCFIGSKENERLFFSGPNNKTKSYNFYLLNHYIYSQDK
ncbi:hypothetical protein C2G38_915428 [Gigaspora rosea]|uniref:WD40-repeat-containing domain protein n=1 Tax=Gigaspora rosea TaxID=44941 RepID=A0A397VKI9_9GLOM|nr:hypothetical protein C2G38_915428 [Gigaspora rosea]